MTPELVTAILAAIVSVVSAIFSIYGQNRIARLTNQLAKQRDDELREAQTARLMDKYKNPLLRSAIDLQSRLYNIHEQNFLGYIYDSSQSAKQYAVQNTLYVIAEYLGWVEILRREIQFLDLGDSARNRQLSELLIGINQAFSRGKRGGIFQLYNGEQRAIGEIMTTVNPGNNGSGYECMGYATFVKQMNDPNFLRWFEKLESDIDKIVNTPEADVKRVAAIHGRLIDLIDFLDPHRIVIPPRYRTRISE